MTLGHNDKNIELKQKLSQKQKALRFLTVLGNKLRQEKNKLKNLFEIMNKEEQDVKDLEQLSFVSLYYGIMGDKQQKLKQEQVEFFSAKLKYDSCQSSITSLKREIQGYEKKVRDCDSFEVEYVQSLKNNESNANGNNSKQYIAIADEIVRLNSSSIEINEAIAAGKLVRFALKDVIENMQSAANWGLFDMFGGGLIVTAIKHSKINQSQKKIEKIKILIDKFHRELADIESPPNSKLDVNISGFNTFADYFLDGLIFDWMVQSKIHKCKNALIDTENEISQILKLLLSEFSRSKKQVADVKKIKLDLFEISK